MLLSDMVSDGYFNPRSREGSDARRRSPGLCRTNFNPRSREGSDLPASSFMSYWLAFQSALPRGERRCVYSSMTASFYFNPRSREGSDGYNAPLSTVL